jgi:hypothetical protein
LFTCPPTLTGKTEAKELKEDRPSSGSLKAGHSRAGGNPEHQGLYVLPTAGGGSVGVDGEGGRERCSMAQGSWLGDPNI